MSIRPEWLWKIMDGRKTVEVRKTKPRLEPPFKVYLYCTKRGDELWCGDKANQRTFGRGGSYRMNGTVCAEFVCDNIYRIGISREKVWTLTDGGLEVTDRLSMMRENETCLTLEQLHDYLGSKDGYGWHITDVHTYTNARSVGDFHFCGCTNRVTRAPMSWCCVEEYGNA